MVIQSLAGLLPDSFEQFLPGLRPWIEGIGNSPLSDKLESLFAFIEVFHILGLFILGGVAILLGLRLIGVGMVEASPSLTWKNTRIWMHFGVFLVLASGILLGISNAEKLYTSVAFIVKMISLLAAIIFTYFVTAPVAKADGAASKMTRVALAAASLIWLYSVLIFIFKTGLNPGIFHVMTAGALMAFAGATGRLRWALVIGLAVIMIPWQVVTHMVITQGESQEQLDVYYKANVAFMIPTALWILGVMGLNVFGVGAAADSSRLTRMVGYSTVLVWVTVAAAGRWIAFAS